MIEVSTFNALVPMTLLLTCEESGTGAKFYFKISAN